MRSKMLGKMLTTAVAVAALFTSTLLADAGSVSRVDSSTREIEVKVAETIYTAAEADVRLLDKDGKPASLRDFTPGAKVEVTIAEGKVTAIQLQ